MWSLPDSPELEHWPGKMYQGPSGELFLQLYTELNCSLGDRVQSEGSVRLVGHTELPADFDGPNCITVDQAVLRSWNDHQRYQGKQGFQCSLYLFRLESVLVGQWFLQGDIRFPVMILGGKDWEAWSQSATWIAHTPWAQVERAKYSRRMRFRRSEASVVLRWECLKEEGLPNQTWKQLLEGIRVLASLGMGYEVRCEHVVFPMDFEEEPECSYEARLWTPDTSPQIIQSSYRERCPQIRFNFASLGTEAKPGNCSQDALTTWLKTYLQAPRALNGVLAALIPSGGIADQRDLMNLVTGIEAFYRLPENRNDRNRVYLGHCLKRLMNETLFYQKILPKPVPPNFKDDIVDWRNRISHGLTDVPLQEMYQDCHLIVLRLAYQARLMRFLGFSEEFICSRLPLSSSIT